MKHRDRSNERKQVAVNIGREHSCNRPYCEVIPDHNMPQPM